MTVYKVLVSHINPDISFEPIPEAPWSQSVPDDEALIVLLNRIAIASSQSKPLEYPEVEITAESRRAFITIVNGHLYYTERNSNRQNLQVVAENIPDLLKGLPVELEKPREETYVRERHQPNRRYHGSGPSGGVFRAVFWGIFIALFAICAIRVFRELSYRPSLFQRPEFIYQKSGATVFMERYAGLYVNEYREGSYVLELEATGELHVYELWRSPKLGTYMRVPVANYAVQYGLHDDEPSLIADSKYLLKPIDPRALSMYGLEFRRHDGAITELGPVTEGPQ
ncbi:MAG: hypothetical protein ACPGKS_07935 [Coraliomargarita sp.]